MRPEHVAQARLIIAWGNNVTVSQLHLMPIINSARKQGAKLVVVDPRRVQIARKADLHLAIKPGTDVVLAWALMAEIERLGGLDHAFIARHVQGAEAFLAQARRFTMAEAAEICGIPAQQIQQLACCTRRPLQRSSARHGPRAQPQWRQRLARRVCAAGLDGKVWRAGWWPAMGASSAFPTMARLQGEEFLPPGTRTLNIVTIGRDLCDANLAPPIKGLFIYNHNPLIVHPDQNAMRRGLLRDDLFTVACDVVMTDSVRYADVVLPACTHFEHAELYAAYGSTSYSAPSRSSHRWGRPCPTRRSSAVWRAALASQNPPCRPAMRTHGRRAGAR